MWNSWHLRHIALDDSPVHLACREDLLRHLPRPGDSGPVLELGSGQGFDAVAIARAGYRVEALDFSPVALEIARKEVAGHSDLQVHYLGRDISLSLPYRAASFSGIYSYLALHYFDTVTTRKIFGEIARVASRECVFRHFFNSAELRSVLREAWTIRELLPVRAHYLSKVEPEGGIMKVLAFRK